MAQAREAVVKVKPPRPLRGRPPQEPRTTLARWLRDRGVTAVDASVRMAAIADKYGLPYNAAPTPKTLLDAASGRHWPHPITIMLVRHLTGGDVDLEHWVRDLRHRWPFEQREWRATQNWAKSSE